MIHTQYDIIGALQAYRHSSIYSQPEGDPYHSKNIGKQMNQFLENQLSTS